MHLTSPVISPALRGAIDEQLAGQAPPIAIPVIFSLKISPENPREGVQATKAALRRLIERTVEGRYDPSVGESDFYLFARLAPEHILRLAVRRDLIDVVWLDHTCKAHLLSSVETVKASPCWRMFEAQGKDITWAVLDTGIKADHPHFGRFTNVLTNLSMSFVIGEPGYDDLNGHGTHVAGIIAGYAPAKPDGSSYQAARYKEDPDVPVIENLPEIPSGVAPQTKLIAVKVLDKDANGQASTAIQGLEYVRKLNATSRDTRVDGANLSLGYPLEQQSYGCGHSPLCEEVNRAVRSGLNVVISCGNNGFGIANVDVAGETRRVGMGFALSISDPANAEMCIAVGSVHKSAPHKYGVSYFSSKGPTGDGRIKPDLVAPGEKIVSCSLQVGSHEYEERSGTSMAAPHVSGAIAVFLSLHPEFRGNPEEVKRILLSTAMDLGRDGTFQGRGLVDLLKAVMAV